MVWSYPGRSLFDEERPTCCLPSQTCIVLIHDCSDDPLPLFIIMVEVMDSIILSHSRLLFVCLKY